MKKTNQWVVLIVLIVFATNISQLPLLVESGVTRYLSFPGWIIVFIILAMEEKIRFGRLEIKIMIMVFLFTMGTLIADLCTPFKQLSSNLIPVFYLSIFILLIGLFSSKLLREEDLYKVIYSYVISMFIVSINVFIEVFSGGYNWLRIGYAYGSKNSISPMIFTAMIFFLFIYKPTSRLKKIFKSCTLLFWLILLLALKSRTTILSLLFVPFVVIGYSKLHIKWKITISLLLIGLSLLLNYNPMLKEIVIDGVLLGGRGGTSINEISSGRMDHLTLYFPMWIKGNELFGTGTLYVESFPFNAILKHGLLVGWILIVVALWPIIWAIRNANRHNILHITFLIISISYSFNGLFEAQAPFGPGTKNYILWLMFGLLYGESRKQRRQNKIQERMSL